MIKFYGGYSEQRQAHAVGLGFTDDNLRLLMEGKPIVVTSESLGLSGFKLVIFAAQDQQGIENCLNEMLKSYIKDTKLDVMHMAKEYYILPIFLPISSDSEPVYFVGFDNHSCNTLRSTGKLSSFRVRFVKGNGTSVEVFLFWGKDQDMMEESFYASGLIGPDTKISRPRPRFIPDGQHRHKTLER